jgi:antirestriction protein
MNNSNKKYGMGGAVQSFSSPMLAQGMQGGLSGFGTSGLQTFADGGQTTTIQDILAKYKAMESAKAKEDPTNEFIRKSWEGKNIDDYIMYSDKYNKGGKMAKGDYEKLYNSLSDDEREELMRETIGIGRTPSSEYKTFSQLTNYHKERVENYFMKKMAHGGVIQHGLQEGDKIVKQVDEKYLIVASKGGVYSVVDIEKGSRFIVGLDDSKTSGKRKSVKAGVKEAMEYINYLKSTKMANGGKFAQGGTLEDAKIYVADLAEYNNGRLVGKWLELSDYSSGAEVMEAIQEMLDEQTKKDKFGDIHEEYAIHDYEGFPRSFYSEYMGESDFDALYEMMKVADSSNLPLEVLMEAVSDLGYEDDPERVAEAYYSSVPASMGNEWRDFAYEYIDSIGSITEAVSKPEYYFDFENFGSDVRMDYSEEELEEMGYNDLSDEQLGEQMADEMGGVKYLGEKLIETYFDYDKFGRELEYDFIAVRGKDGDYYFFNRNFAKGGEVKNKKEVDIKNTRYRVVVTNSSSNENIQGLYFIEASSKERAEEIALEKFKKEFGTRRGISIYVDSIKEVPMQDGKERTRKYFVRLRNSKGSEMEVFIIDAFEETTAVRRAFAMFRKKYERPSAYDDDAEVFFPVIETIYPIDEIRKEGVTTYRRTFAKGGQISKDFYAVVRLPKGLITKKDFDGFSKDEIIQWCEERGWKYNAKGEKLGGQVLKNYEFFVKESKRVNLGQLPHKKYAKGGKVGFEGLAKKVAKRYVGKKVSKEYQAEYGKTYDAKEAKEVGNKVAGKVYQQQVAKKKIVRKLQRKTN